MLSMQLSISIFLKCGKSKYRIINYENLINLLIFNRSINIWFEFSPAGVTRLMMPPLAAFIVWWRHESILHGATYMGTRYFKLAFRL